MTNEKSEIEKKALALPDMVKVIVVRDEETLERAGRAKVYCKTIRKGIIEDYKPMKASAKETHKKICDREKKALEPVEEAETYINGQIASYMAKVAQKLREAEQKERDRRLALKRAEAERHQKVTDAMSKGETEKAREILSEPRPSEAIVPSEPPPPPAPKMKNVHLREHWAFEIINEDDIPAEFWALDMQKIGAVVRSDKGNTNIPGIRVFKKDIVV